MRIDKMRKVNEYVEKLKSEVMDAIKGASEEDALAYKDFLKDLLVQVSYHNHFLFDIDWFYRV